MVQVRQRQPRETDAKERLQVRQLGCKNGQLVEMAGGERPWDPTMKYQAKESEWLGENERDKKRGRMKADPGGVWEHRGVQRSHPSGLEEVDEEKLSRRTGGNVQVWRPQQNERGDWSKNHGLISLEVLRSRAWPSP